MTVKAGQKCTAIRRAMAPAAAPRRGRGGDRAEAGRRRKSAIRATRPTAWARWSPAPSATTSARQVAKLVAAGARIVSGNLEASVGPDGGAFMDPILLRADDPVGAAAVHDVEAFGPVSTIMPYRDLADAIALANRGMGSLALSLFTYSPDGRARLHPRRRAVPRPHAGHQPRQRRRIAPATARPLPVLVHGGPGRAGGSEEMGGVRGVKHYMQRTAIQSTPAMIAAISEQYIPGAPQACSSTPTRSASA